MSNHFPPVPSDFQISDISYLVSLPAAGLTPVSGSPLWFDGTVVEGQMNSPGSLNWSYQVVFVTPGNVGTFDQDVVENALAALAHNFCQAMATSANVTVASLTSQCSIQRQMNWTSPSTSMRMSASGTVPVT